ncbi:aminotransferase class V-fold PLP-dependent enzyme [Pseudoglutamicibacter albus]|uniref:cysteine desulfurase family protein n=1 Tax=Pseudoglutamicibacter albus TaxID=98671 RepID=UPI0015DE05B2|nr:aminotransferase class V-fold PLP-dependent enzyme [Pseudoglutamicibacter albus]WIK84440.1 aminotransferase class V-fold PLP-dependent enzyme [Pseudoglutamicibacter albus]
MLYLDEVASAPQSAESLRHHVAWLQQGIGNPASVHAAGASMRSGLDSARSLIAQGLNVADSSVVFTSGGTEANAMAVTGLARAARDTQPERTRILVSAIEHSSVLNPARDVAHREGFSLEQIPVDSRGLLDVDALASMIDERVALVAVMAVNNEVGSVQPIEAVARLARDDGAAVVCDAVAAPVPLMPGLVAHCDALTLAGHKFGGPTGTGALVLAGNVAKVRGFVPMLPGSQEHGLRAGTPNVPGLMGMAAAFSEKLAAGTAAGETPAEQLKRVVLAHAGDEVVAVGPDTPQDCSPSIAMFLFPRVNGEAMLIELEHRGVVCSSGSACHAGSTEPSHVLTAMGIAAAQARTSVRMSIGRRLSQEEEATLGTAVAESLASLVPATPTPRTPTARTPAPSPR